MQRLVQAIHQLRFAPIRFIEIAMVTGVSFGVTMILMLRFLENALQFLLSWHHPPVDDLHLGVPMGAAAGAAFGLSMSAYAEYRRRTAGMGRSGLHPPGGAPGV